jgi:hypothetical protein
MNSTIQEVVEMYIKRVLCILTFGLACWLPALANADTLTLKDGQTLSGTVVGRGDGIVTFNIGGQEIQIPESNIASLQIDMGGNSTPSASPAPAPAAAPAPAPAPAPATTNQALTAPAGTRLTVRMAEAIDTKRHKAGHRFTAKLEADLVAGNTVIAERGSTVYGQLASAKSSGRVAGSSEMTIIFTDIRVNNRMYAIATNPLSGKTDNTAGDSARRTGRAAAIGGLINGSSGAKTGAKVGLGTSILTGGKQISVPAGTLLDTELRVPLTIE